MEVKGSGYFLRKCQRVWKRKIYRGEESIARTAQKFDKKEMDRSQKQRKIEKTKEKLHTSGKKLIQHKMGVFVYAAGSVRAKICDSHVEFFKSETESTMKN